MLVDGKPRVSCVTPARRVAGRAITTLDGFDADLRASWGEAFAGCGGSQCGFCTPGIIVRLEALRRDGITDQEKVARALQAHLCRCTGWQTIVESYESFGTEPPPRDWEAASLRAGIEGHAPQMVGGAVALGAGGFADDTAPAEALVAVRSVSGEWVLGETLTDARGRSGKVQGRRTTAHVAPPLEAPPGDWGAVLRTSWVDPAYLEVDASWCGTDGSCASPLANGGAFGAKLTSPLPEVAAGLAQAHGRPVRALYSREDAVRLGPKRPPVAGGANADGSGLLRVARTPGIAATVNAVAPDLVVEEVEVEGPATSAPANAQPAGRRRSCCSLEPAARWA